MAGRPVVALVPVERVQFHPRNIRRELGDLRELAASLRAEGVLQPLLLHRKGAVLEVVDGHRRLAAARLAGVRKVPAMVVDQLGDGEVLTRMLGTALNKRDITRDERREALVRLTTEFGHSRAALAERLGVSVATIGNWLARPEERQHKARRATAPRVDATRLEEVLNVWGERAEVGLAPAAAHELLGELRALLTAGASGGSSAPSIAPRVDRVIRAVRGRVDAETASEVCPVSEIIDAAAGEFGVERDSLLGRDRRPEITTARQVAMYVARELTDLSLRAIGCRMGGREYTTVLHGIRRVGFALTTEALSGAGRESEGRAA